MDGWWQDDQFLGVQFFLSINQYKRAFGGGGLYVDRRLPALKGDLYSSVLLYFLSKDVLILQLARRLT